MELHNNAAGAASTMTIIVRSAVAVLSWEATTRSRHCWPACLLFLIDFQSKYYIGRMISTLNLVVFSNLTNKVAKSLINVDALLSRCLDELAAEVLSKVTTL